MKQKKVRDFEVFKSERTLDCLVFKKVKEKFK